MVEVGSCSFGGITGRKEKNVRGGEEEFANSFSENWKIQPKFLTDGDFWHAYWLGTHNIVHTSIESGL